MIEKTLRTTDGKLKVRIPTILNEITLGQMMQMQKKHYLNDLEAISILSGIPKEELYTVSNFDDFQVFGEYVQSLAHQIKYLYNSDIVPHKVTFMLGKRKVVVNVIRNLSVEPAGAFLAARDIIADEINAHISLYGEEGWQEHFQPSLKSCCNVLAQYFFCRATGKKYDEYEAEEFNEEIKKLRVTEALPIAKHFFSCYPDLLKQKIGFFQRLHQYWRRKQVFRRLKNLNT
ncbi:MAG TPA: hypothetical protein VK671_08745 [Mucilaginibacter sp.]|jgi:hypothetical protein|nr:hypothetical protein [Mucilaginibacter sp.]